MFLSLIVELGPPVRDGVADELVYHEPDFIGQIKKTECLLWVHVAVSVTGLNVKVKGGRE